MGGLIFHCTGTALLRSRGFLPVRYSGRGGRRQPWFVGVHSVPNTIRGRGLFSVRDRLPPRFATNTLLLTLHLRFLPPFLRPRVPPLRDPADCSYEVSFRGCRCSSPFPHRPYVVVSCGKLAVSLQTFWWFESRRGDSSIIQGTSQNEKPRRTGP